MEGGGPAGVATLEVVENSYQLLSSVKSSFYVDIRCFLCYTKVARPSMVSIN
jgi:hypothetical protein